MLPARPSLARRASWSAQHLVVDAVTSLTLPPVSITFLLLVALSVAVTVQVIGTLLIFALLVAPGAAALQLTARPLLGLTLTIVLSLVFTWSGLAVAYFSGYPVGFFITSLAFAGYGLIRVVRLAQASLSPA